MCVKYDVPSCHEMGDYKTGDCLLNGEGKRTGFCLLYLLELESIFFLVFS